MFFTVSDLLILTQLVRMFLYLAWIDLNISYQF